MHLLLLIQEAAPEAANGSSLLSPNAGLMVWTLLIFGVVWFILSRFAFPKITDAVRAREEALQQAIESAQRDREAAGRLLADQREQIEVARQEAQRIIAESRSAGERVRAEMMEQTQTQQVEMLDRARREIVAERDRAIADLRREAVDLAIAGASRVINRNLDDQTNRDLVEGFLASIPTAKIAPKAGV